MNHSIYNKYNFLKLEKKFDLYFEDKELLITAFTHTSEASEINMNYQRMEFLGDAVLQLIVSDHLYRNNSLQKEGVMSKVRAILVSEKSLLKIMEMENIDQYIIVGNSIIKDTNQEQKKSYIADIYESFVAAIYLDQGFEKASEFVEKTLLSRKKELIAAEEVQDYKTQLQEILQKNGAIEIKYETIKKEQNLFTSNVVVSGSNIGKGNGNNKKEAEQNAAKSALLFQI